MSVNFKDPLDSPVTNAAYLSRTVNSNTTAVIALLNVGSGGDIVNLQQAINKLFLDTGVLGETNTLSKTYTEENFIDNGDNYRLAIDKIDISLNAEQVARQNADQELEDTILNGAVKFKSYATDSAYEADNPSPLVGGEAYYNTTINRIRSYNVAASLWETVDAALIAVQEVPTGLVDGINTIYVTSQIPVSEDALQVFINGVLLQRSSWSYDTSSGEIDLVNAPALGQSIQVYYLTQGVPNQPILTKVEKVEYIELEAADITAKEVQLNEIAENYNTVMVDVCRSAIGSLINLTDFGIDDVLSGPDVVGTKIIWDGLGFETDATAGQVLRVFYFVQE